MRNLVVRPFLLASLQMAASVNLGFQGSFQGQAPVKDDRLCLTACENDRGRSEVAVRDE